MDAQRLMVGYVRGTKLIGAHRAYSFGLVASYPRMYVPVTAEGDLLFVANQVFYSALKSVEYEWAEDAVWAQWNAVFGLNGSLSGGA